MRTAITVFTLTLSTLAFAQSPAPGTATITPDGYIAGITYQADNPNYMVRNVFHFEGRVDWNLLKITTPSTMWEYVQRGIHNQDDLEDYPAAIADFRKALSIDNLANGGCQILTTAAAAVTNVNPPPCMFTPRLRLAHLIEEEHPDDAIQLLGEVTQIDPLRLGVHELIGEAWEVKAKHTDDLTQKDTYLEHAIEAFHAELALSPVTAQTIALTGDKANNAHTHWALAEIYHELGEKDEQAHELQAYLDATQWHSDTYAWRIKLAKARLDKLH